MPEPEVIETPSAPPVVEPVEPIEGEPAVEVKTTEEPPKKIDDAGDPSAEHPRFKQVYGDMKRAKRELEETKTSMDELRKMNEDILATVDGIQERDYQARMPDPLENPAEYQKHVAEGAENAQKKAQREVVKPAPVPQNNIDSQIETMREVYPDYNEVIALAEVAMKNDPVLEDEIFGEKNPALAGYRYGQKLKQAEANRRQANLDAGYVEGGTSPPSNPPKSKLTDAQKAKAKQYGISEEAYLKNMIALGRNA